MVVFHTFKLSARWKEKDKFFKLLVQKWIKDKNATILVVAGGEKEYRILKSIRYTRVVITNISKPKNIKSFNPFKFQLQNAENLDYPDKYFDFVLVHDGLHHCSSPHKALLEMYRVAKHAVICFESRDSALMRILEKLKITQTYEITDVYKNSGKFGGVNNTSVPNYIYRWTEREIEKTIFSYAPYAKHNFEYRYSHALPISSWLLNRKRKMLIYLLYPFYYMFSKIFYKQQNLFAFKIDKPNLKEDIYPWLKQKSGNVYINENYLNQSE